jgi:hypothetical protein
MLSRKKNYIENVGVGKKEANADHMHNPNYFSPFNF